MKDWHIAVGLILFILGAVAFMSWFVNARQPRVIDGERVVQLNHRVGPDYILDLELGICFASYGGLVQLDRTTCHKLTMKHTDDHGEVRGEKKMAR